MKPRAFIFIRDLPHYRCGAFCEGAKRAGYEVRRNGSDFRPGDVLLIWNRYGMYHDLATQAERAGAVVLVSENGFAGRDADGNQFYQLAVGGHNGSGWWHVGEEDRLAQQGLTIAPWQPTSPDAHVVVRGQRGIGRPGVGSPPDWHNQVAHRLRQFTKRRVVVVPHPGNGAVDDTKHEQYLQGAHALVVWSSSVGVKALLMGVPVIAESKYWVCKLAAHRVEDVEWSTPRDEHSNGLRRLALHRMAWAQWSLAEISSGEPMRLLVDKYQQHLQGVEALA